MDKSVKNMFSSWDGICNNDNMYNILHLSYTINTISNSEEFSFSGCYIHCMMNSFGNDVLFFINI